MRPLKITATCCLARCIREVGEERGPAERLHQPGQGADQGIQKEAGTEQLIHVS